MICVVRCFETIERVKSEYCIARDWTKAGKSLALKTSVGGISIEESITVAYFEVCAAKFV